MIRVENIGSRRYHLLVIRNRKGDTTVKTLSKIGIVVAIVLLVGACTTFELSGVHIVEDMPSMQPMGDFEAKVSVHEFLGNSGGANLFNVTADAMDNEIYDTIRREVEKRSGDAAINVTIRYEASFINLLLNGLTFGVYAPATATVSGTVVSYN
jgi:hypothetical protein